MAKQDLHVRYTIRVPAPLYEKLRQSAGEKSVNAEIIAALEQWLSGQTQQQLDRIEAAVQQLVAQHQRRPTEDEPLPWLHQVQS